jgi:DNA processing protein
MWDFDDSLAWTVLAAAPGLDAERMAEAVALMGSPAAVARGSAADWERAGMPATTCEFLRSAAAVPGKAVRRWLAEEQHHVLPYCDPRFPQLLRALPQCPVALYVSGHLNALADPQLAIVGSRNPTAQGRETAFDFAEYFAERGLGITSGLAEGIDSSAHRGALRGQGITIGVLGTGIDLVYPASNAALHQEICHTGALISEFPIGTPPRRGNFPQRNRLIAGLTLGTLVVEAAQRSGSLITARLANALGREVFAIPGSIHNPLSRGCHELIKDGGKLVDSGDDILRELNFSAFFSNEIPAKSGPISASSPRPGMDKEHKILLDALGFDPMDLDTLIARTGFKPEAVSSMVLILELEGHVQSAPGGRYSRVANRRAGGER